MGKDKKKRTSPAIRDVDVLTFDPGYTGTRRAILLQRGKGLLRPWEIPRLERIG